MPNVFITWVKPSSRCFQVTTLFGGEIPIAGIAGDQQAALFGSGLLRTWYG